MKNMTLFASIRCAVKGIGKAFRTEKNFAYYGVIWFVMFCVDLYAGVSASEHCLVVGVTAAVFAAEFINTAIERMADLIHPQFSKAIADIKDIAAAAVLSFGIAFFIIQGIILVPKLWL